MCDAQGRSIHQFHKDPERIRNIFRALTTGTTRERSTELVLGGVTFALSFTPISSAEGKVLAFHASWRDISEMPEMDGFTLTRQMKEDDVLRAFPVVVHSSLSGSANESHANRVGADGDVAKFVPDELARAVAKALAPPPR